VIVFQFEDCGVELTLLPMAARRALDAAGLKLSLAAWQSLPVEGRCRIAELGSAPRVDVPHVLTELEALTAECQRIAVENEPGPEGPPSQVAIAFGETLPIPAGTWAALSALERYTLAKVARKPRRDRLAAAHAEIIGASALSSHLSAAGGVRMVDVGSKPNTERRAEAEAVVHMSAEAFERLRSGTAPKGDVLSTARVAAILAAKRTPELIPLCHVVALTRVDVNFDFDVVKHAVTVRVAADAVDRTGVEMEAMTAASVAALTIYDMLKGIDRGIEIGPIRLNRKSGGRTGDFTR
jgi:cyclic pyranopterin phosphate synthase